MEFKFWYLLSFAAFSIAWQSPGSPCPVPCSISGNSLTNWTDFHGIVALERCHEPVLVDTAIWTDIHDPLAPVTFRSCTASDSNSSTSVEYSPAPFTFDKPLQRRSWNHPSTPKLHNRSVSNTTIPAHGCGPNAKSLAGNSTVDLLTWSLPGKG